MRFVILLTSLFLSGSLLGQFLPAKRIGTEDTPSESAAHLLGKDNMVLGYFPAEVKDRRRDFVLTFLDPQLNERSSLRIPLQEKYQLIHSFYGNASAWFLFWYESLDGRYLVIEAKDETFRMFEWQVPGLGYQGALFYKDQLVVAGQGNHELIMASVNLQTQAKAAWRIPLAYQTEVYEFRGNRQAQEFEVLIREKDGPVKWIRWGIDGFVNEVLEVTLEGDLWPVAVTRQGKMVLGTYSNDENGSAQGLFFTREVEGQTGPLVTLNFLDIPGFWEAVSETEAKGWGGSRKKREKNGLLEDYRVKWRLMEESASKSLLVGEVARATYRLESYEEPDEYNRPILKYRKVFDGWLISHGIFVELNSDLNPQVVSAFEFDDVRTYADVYRCHFKQQRLLFPQKGELQTLEISSGKFLPGESKPIFDDERQMDGWAVGLFPHQDDLVVWGHRDLLKEKTFLNTSTSRNYFFHRFPLP